MPSRLIPASMIVPAHPVDAPLVRPKPSGPFLRRSGRAMLLLSGLLLLAAGSIAREAGARTTPKAPNVVIIFTDDLGYGDVGVYGGKGYVTPNLDRLASEGIRFTDFYAAQPVCTASRVALLTGCYPNRIGLTGALGPQSHLGFHPDEVTLAELLKQRGYATAIYGKWHVGDHPDFLPTRHGFDEFVGIPYSNDMWPHHPLNSKYPELPLLQDEKILNPAVTSADQEQFTTLFTERAVDFIRRNRQRPFFLYLAHPMPHVPLHVSDRFRGKSERGLFGDVMMEIDWSVGEVVRTLAELGLAENTLVLFISDNGPWLPYGNHAGSAGILRAGKHSTWDGGVRVPFLARWPGTIPAGSVCREPAMTIDLFPTIAHLTGAPLPVHPIDGKSIWPLLAGDALARAPQEAYFFYRNHQLQAVRSGHWSLHFAHEYLDSAQPGADGRPSSFEHRETPLALFDLKNDPGQRINLAAHYPRVVETLTGFANQARADMGDELTGAKGTGLRPAGQRPKAGSRK